MKRKVEIQFRELIAANGRNFKVEFKYQRNPIYFFCLGNFWMVRIKDDLQEYPINFNLGKVEEKRFEIFTHFMGKSINIKVALSKIISITLI